MCSGVADKLIYIRSTYSHATHSKASGWDETAGESRVSAETRLRTVSDASRNRVRTSNQAWKGTHLASRNLWSPVLNEAIGKLAHHIVAQRPIAVWKQRRNRIGDKHSAIGTRPGESQYRASQRRRAILAVRGQKSLATSAPSHVYDICVSHYLSSFGMLFVLQ
jgi:hypothetical protein